MVYETIETACRRHEETIPWVSCRVRLKSTRSSRLIPSWIWNAFENTGQEDGIQGKCKKKNILSVNTMKNIFSVQFVFGGNYRGFEPSKKI